MPLLSQFCYFCCQQHCPQDKSQEKQKPVLSMSIKGVLDNHMNTLTISFNYSNKLKNTTSLKLFPEKPPRAVVGSRGPLNALKHESVEVKC